MGLGSRDQNNKTQHEAHPIFRPYLDVNMMITVLVRDLFKRWFAS